MYFSAEDLAQMRAAARRLRPERFPEGTPNGWSVCPANPGRLLAAFPWLSLRAEYELHAYQYRQGPDGHTLVFAMPADEALPPLAGGARPPRPAQALPDVMEAIRAASSDGASIQEDSAIHPEAAVQAALLLRELSEFSAFGAGLDWSHYHILGADPWAAPEAGMSYGAAAPSGSPDDWEWSAPQPRDFSPRALAQAGTIQVIFYLYTLLGSDTALGGNTALREEQIIESVDTFRGQSCAFQTRARPIANRFER